jgi:hypothetical protein
MWLKVCSYLVYLWQKEYEIREFKVHSVVEKDGLQDWKLLLGLTGTVAVGQVCLPTSRSTYKCCESVLLFSSILCCSGASEEDVRRISRNLTLRIVYRKPHQVSSNVYLIWGLIAQRISQIITTWLWDLRFSQQWSWPCYFSRLWRRVDS